MTDQHADAVPHPDTVTTPAAVAAVAAYVADHPASAPVDSFSFADYTTLRCGGTPLYAVKATTDEALADIVAFCDDHQLPVLVVGGGSNLVVADGDLDLVAVIAANTDITCDTDTGRVTAGAGAVWDDVVKKTVELGLGGIEALSGIPGSAGATPVQNVGAYGAEIADVLTRVKLYNRKTKETSWVDASELDLAYRYSNLKFTSRGVVLGIEMQLTTDGLSAPLRYGELARQLQATASTTSDSTDSEASQRFPVAVVRDAVLGLRRGKGMVLDSDDPDTYSAGSFFTNPIITTTQWRTVEEAIRTRLAEAATGTSAEQVATAVAIPHWPVDDEHVKLSAAWLIERAGFSKGYPGEGAARLSSKHTLALTNHDHATSADIVELAHTIRNGVNDAFGVELHPEPVWIGLAPL